MEIKAAFDIETWGSRAEYSLQPWRVADKDAWITTFASAFDGSCQARVVTSTDKLTTALDKLSYRNLGGAVVGWNIKFDIAWLLAYGLEDQVRQVKWLDAALLLKRIEPFRSGFGLKAAVAEEFPAYAGYEEDVDYGATSGAELKKLLAYNKLDSIFTLRLARMYASRMSHAAFRAAVVEADCLVDVAKAWMHGIKIDTAALAELETELTATIKQSCEDFGVDLKTLGSPTKLCQLLYSDMQLPVVKLTPKGKPSADVEAITQLALDHQELTPLLAAKAASTGRSKFVKSVYSSLEYLASPSNLSYPEPVIGGTYTGRMTYYSKQRADKRKLPVGVALHQWPKKGEYRKSIVAPDGFVYGELDAAGQEARWMACIAPESTMLDIFANDKDFHANTGARLKNIDYDYLVANKETDEACGKARDLGKFFNLSAFYRIGQERLRIRALVKHDLPLTAAEAGYYKSIFLATYPGIRHYWDAQIEFAARHGYVMTLAGRVYPLEDLSDYGTQQTAINAPIQGTGAEQKYLTMAYLKNPVRKMGGRFAFDLHDGLYYLLPDTSSAADNLLELRHIASNLPYKKAWGYEPPISFPFDAKIGPTWGDLKKL